MKVTGLVNDTSVHSFLTKGRKDFKNLQCQSYLDHQQPKLYPPSLQAQDLLCTICIVSSQQLGQNRKRIYLGSHSYGRKEHRNKS